MTTIRFRRLDAIEEEQFRAGAREAVGQALYASGVAGVSNGCLVLDLELTHPVFLEEAGKAIVEHAQSRMSRIGKVR
jgi:hypothetical protein